MKKIFSLILVFSFMHIPSSTALAAVQDSILIRPSCFYTNGHWSSDNYTDAFGGFTLIASGALERPSESAIARIDVPTAANYIIWFHTRDFNENQPGSRYFHADINGNQLTKDRSLDNPENTVVSTMPSNRFGTHGFEGFRWEKASSPIPLNQGLNTLSLIGKSTYARVDAIFITTEQNANPSDLSYEHLLENCRSVNPMNANATIPEYTKMDGTLNSILSISNEAVSISFFQKTYQGKTYIQRQTSISGIPLDSPSDGIGYLLLYASQATPMTNNFSTMVFKTSIPWQDGQRSMATNDVYRSALQIWLIPDRMEKLPNGDIILSASDSQYGDLTATWSLKSGDMEPVVTISFKAKQDGYYSIGMFNSPSERNKDDVDYILLPFRYQEMRLPIDPILLSEAYSTTALTMMTLKGSDKISVGIVPDVTQLEHRWAYHSNEYTVYDTPSSTKVIDRTENQVRFGLGITGPDRQVLPALFAPVMGAENAYFTANQSFSYAYRPVTLRGDWYDLYSHCINNIFGIRDYRDNYYDSMTNTIFNMYNLLLDDYASGWNDDGKAHYNMEGRNIVTVSDPLTYMQLYLLTEDKEMLERRVIPTMEYLLGRSEFHYAYDAIAGSTDYFIQSIFRNEPTGYAKPGPHFDRGGVYGFGNSVYAGAYIMSRGLMPTYRDLGKNADRMTYLARPEVAPTNVTIYNFSELLWKYRLDKTANTLNRTNIHANNYVDYRVNVAQKNVVPDVNFIYIDFYPQFQPLLEYYEFTGDLKFLTAAKKAAASLITTLWAAPMPEESKTITLSNQDVMDTGKTRSGGNTMFFRGDQRDRIGVLETTNQNGSHMPYGTSETALKQSEEAIPEWVVSRVGLGVEQTSTFRGLLSNIIMSTWAGDLMRLSAHLEDNGMGDDNFKTFARNSIVGRYENYPGYYFNQFMTFPNSKDYAYLGPDFTNLYFHHIPVLLGALQDFLFASAYERSSGGVDFKNTRNQGYAWFNNRHYGAESGNVFDMDNMWPWLKEGTITVDNKQVDWLGARKDNQAAFVFMNASNQSVTTTVTLGKDAGGNISSDAWLYNEKGEKTNARIESGKMVITLAPKGMAAIGYQSSGIKAPEHSKIPLEQLENNDASGTTAKASIIETNDVEGHVIQMSQNEYYAYVYTTHKSAAGGGDIKSATLEYSIGDGETKQVSDDKFPFEFSIKVNDASKNFKFKMILTSEDLSTHGMTEEKILSATYSAPHTGTGVELINKALSLDGKTKSQITQPGDYVLTLNIKNNHGSSVNPIIICALFSDEQLVSIVATDKMDNSIAARSEGTIDTNFTIQPHHIGYKNLELKVFTWADNINPILETIEY